MTADRTNYRAEAESDAKTMFAEFVDELCEQWERDRKVSDDFNNDYSNGDEYHHLTHVDKEYDLSDAAAVLEQLDEFEETDNGLWEGLAPRKAISAQAAFTYGNAVVSMFQDLVRDVNDDLESIKDTIESEPAKRFLVECPEFGKAEECDTREEADDAAEALREEHPDAEVTISEEDNDDATEEAVTLAGQRFLRLYAELINMEREAFDGMAGAAIDGAKEGDWTAALALADMVQEVHGERGQAEAIRNAVK